MNKWMSMGVAAAALGASTVVAVAPADAQRWRGGPGWNRGWHGGGGWNRGGWRDGRGWNRGWRGYRGYRGDRTGVAIGAGLLGLGLGAAIASSNRDRYYDGYYGGGGYYGGSYGYYGRGYRDCYTRRVWDPYLGRRVRVRYCD